MEKINTIRFAVIGMIIWIVFAVIVEIFLWFKYIPTYNALYLSVYGVSLIPQVLKTFGIVLLVTAIVGFILSWASAKIYNSLLRVQIK